MKAVPTGVGDYPSLGAALDFLRLVWAVDHGLHRKSAAMLQAIGVTGPQRLVIRIVGRFPGISLGQLAGLLGAHPSTATGLTKRLIRNGLMRTRRDPRDARRLLLGLTPKGRVVELATTGTIEAAVRELLDTVPRRDVAISRSVLERLLKILEAASG